ncbi:MAG: metal-dependent hydrolase [Acidobacteria bacterium]|nr:MAG: metal-dependent hydrolase [Acidobacteriota bacterium]
MKPRAHALVFVLLLGAAASRPAAQGSALVKITPLGSHAGELCRNDRAMLFEDPTGVRILYDPGRTVDETDPRLGDVHVMLLSHAHTDHLGDARPNRSAPGTCAAPAAGPANPDSNFVSIASAKNAAVIAPGELADFLGRKIQNLRGSATAACNAGGLDNIFDVPLAAPCTATLRPGGSRKARRGGASGPGVRIAVVQAVHSNGINAQFIETPGVAGGLSGYGGSEGGFVLTFTNGLVAYLTGDTGMFGDMNTIVAQYYKPTLIVLNMSDTATLGPEEAAFVIKTLVRPRVVMPTHVNEQATAGGAIRAGTRVDLFTLLVRDVVDVVVPVSDVTRTVDGAGRCIGCR